MAGPAVGHMSDPDDGWEDEDDFEDERPSPEPYRLAAAIAWHLMAAIAALLGVLQLGDASAPKLLLVAPVLAWFGIRVQTGARRMLRWPAASGLMIAALLGFRMLSGDMNVFYAAVGALAAVAGMGSVAAYALMG